MRMVRAAMVTAALLGGIAPTAARADSAPPTVSRQPASRSYAVVALPLRTRVPATWKAFSPLGLQKSGTRNYPAVVKALAKRDHETPATWVEVNQSLNLFSLEPSRLRSGLAIEDAGTGRLSFAQFKRQLASGVLAVQRTSQVRTPVGMAYRVHYRDQDDTLSGDGRTYYGVASMTRVSGHVVVTTSVNSTAPAATAVSDLSLRHLVRR